MIQDIKDRVPVNVLSNDAIRYGIYDEQGNLIRYEYIKREDEPIETGTPINRALFSNLQGDLYTQDRYNKPVVSKESTGVIEVTKTDNLFDQDWVYVSDTQYTSDNGFNLRCDATNTSSHPLQYACDGSESSYWSSPSGTDSHWVFVTLPQAQKITKMSLKIARSNMTNLVIRGRKSSGEYITVYETTTFPSNTKTEIELNNTDFYEAYQLLTYASSASQTLLYEWQVSEYIVLEEQFRFVNNLSLPLTSYEVGKIVNIEGSSYTDGDVEGVETGNIFPTSWDVLTEGIKYSSVDGYILEADSYYGLDVYKASNACDGSDSTYWTSSKGTATRALTIELPKAIKITKMKTKIAVTTGIEFIAKIQGSKDNAGWTDLYTLSANQTALTEVTLSNTDYYAYYRITISATETFQAFVYEWQTSEYIEGVETTSFENPYININNLGAKQINGTIVKGEKYNLVYNGESWDVYVPKEYVVGTYTGDGTEERFIDLGFTPEAVIVRTKSNNGSNSAAGGFAIKGYPVQTNSNYARYAVNIVQNGFTVSSGYDEVQTNETTEGWNPYRYIAFK